MGAHSSGGRALAGFFGLAFVVVVLFGLVALVALRPTDSFAWVQVPDLTADLRLDAGLQTKPLKDAVVAEALNDRGLDGTAAEALAVPPALAIAPPPQPAVAVSLPPAVRPVTAPRTDRDADRITPTNAHARANDGADTDRLADSGTKPDTRANAGPHPNTYPNAGPHPNTHANAGPHTNADPEADTDAHAFPDAQAAVRDQTGRQARYQVKNGNGGRCSQTTVTAAGAFTTNGAGGTVSYEWVRVDSQGNRTIGASGTVRVAAGDTSWHSVATDTFTPVHSGSDQLVFLSPAYTVTAQNWSCVG